jgi:hypothetical protein
VDWVSCLSGTDRLLQYVIIFDWQVGGGGGAQRAKKVFTDSITAVSSNRRSKSNLKLSIDNMSWDIVLFSSRQKIQSVEEIDETLFEPTDFCSVFANHFQQIKQDDDHRSIQGRDFTIEYFLDNEPVSNKILNLYGMNGLYEVIALAKKHNWQIFDTGLGQMIDLENPAINGYEDFQKYLEHILKEKE